MGEGYARLARSSATGLNQAFVHANPAYAKGERIY